MLKYIFIFFFSSFALAASPIILKSEKDIYGLGLHLDILEDKTKKLSINDVTSSKWLPNFKKSTEKVPNFGYSTSAFWIRIIVKNSSPKKNWLFSYNYYNQDRITFFKKEKNKWIQKTTGDLYPLKSRELKERPFLFEITPGKKTTYYFRIEGTDHQVNLTLLTKESFSKSNFNEFVYFAMFTGLVLGILIYNFFIFISTRSRSYLMYTMFLLFFWFFLSLDMGFGQLIFFENYPWFSNEGIAFFISISAFFHLSFTLFYLDLKKENLKLFKIVYWGAIFCLVTSLFCLILPFWFTLKFINLNIIYLVSASFYSGFSQLRKNYRPAKYYLIAFSMILIGAGIFMLMTVGLLPSHEIIRNILPISYSVKVILLSMGLGDRFNYVQEQALLKEQEIAEIKKEYTENLESEVKIQKLNLLKSMSKINYIIDNIKQSLFLVNQNGNVTPPVSKFSKNIFEESIDNKNIFDTIFRSLDKKSEVYSSIDFVFSCVYGEDSIQWDCLKDSLPEKITYISPQGGNKKIKILYNPIFEDKKLKNVLFVVEDITEIQRLEKEMEINTREKNRYIETLHEIVSNKKEDLNLYFTNALKISNEVQNILKLSRKDLENGTFNNENLNTINHKLHTLKGESRVFGFSSISKKVHNLETDLLNFSKEKNILSINIIIQNLYTLNGEIISYLQSANDIFQLDINETGELFKNLHKQFINFEFSLTTFFGSIPQITRYPEMKQALDDVSSRKNKKELISRNLHSLKSLSCCLNEKTLTSYFSKLEERIFSIDYENLEFFQDIEDDLFLLLRKTIDEMKTKITKAKLETGLSIRSKSFLDFFFYTYKLYNSLENFNKQDFTKVLQKLKDLLKNIDSFYLKSTILLINQFLARKNVIKIEIILQNYLKEILSFNYLTYLIEMGLSEDSFKRPSLFILLFDRINKEGLKKEDFFKDMAKLFNAERDNIEESFFPSRKIKNFLKELLLENKNIPEPNLISSMIKLHFKDNPPFFCKVLTSYYNNKGMRWGLYIGAIELTLLSNSFSENLNLKSFKKPNTKEAIPENIDFFKQLLVENHGLPYQKVLNYCEFLFEIPLKYSLHKFNNMVRDISNSLGKKVDFKITGDQGSLDPKRLNLLEEAIIHLIRNSLDHGFETPDKRVSKGKRENGILEIRCLEEKGKMLELIVKDDGEGINTERLCEKAISSGTLKPEDVNNFTEEEKLNIIFLPSISTKEEVSEISGRGVGMDVVKSSLESIGATLDVHSIIDKGTSFTIQISKKLD